VGVALRHLDAREWSPDRLRDYADAIRQANQDTIDAWLRAVQAGGGHGPAPVLALVLPSGFAVARDPAPAAARPPGQGLTPVFAPAPPGPAYVVDALDALWGLAGRLADGATAPDLLEAEGRRLWDRNRSILGDDPARLVPGTEISLPAPA
jgi:hypothetical protein